MAASAQKKDQQPDDYMKSYVHTVSKFVNNSMQLATLKVNTLKQMNDATIVHYEKNLDKIQKINDEVQQSGAEYEKLKGYFKRLDEIGNCIEGMESSIDYLDIVLNRIDSKLTEVENLK